MLTISRPLSAAQARAYHLREFTNIEQSYFSQDRQVQGEWLGKLAKEWGLQGPVTDERFTRLANGQHPVTGQQLVRHRPSFEYRNHRGKIIKTMEHRAGWDATFSAPKSVSLTALIGGDERVRQAHRESVGVALSELERFVEAHQARVHPVQVTGRWIAAKFEHDSARPVEGYAAPHLHTHVVFFNLTETGDGKTHSIQIRELYKSRQYGTAIYRAELGYRLRQLGYEVEVGKTSAPEIKGYTQEYLEASSPRHKQIRAHLEERGLRGAVADQIAFYSTRSEKNSLRGGEMLEQHRSLAARFGNQAQHVVEEANARSNELHRVSADAAQRQAQEAITYSREHNTNRDAVVDERDLLRDALKRALGYSTFQDLRDNFETRLRCGDFLEVHQERDSYVARVLTMGEILHYERDNILQIEQEQGKRVSLVPSGQRQNLVDPSVVHRQAGEQMLRNCEQLVGLQDIASPAKTSSAVAVCEAAKRKEHQVEGIALTAHTAEQLEDAGIHWKTLPCFVAHDRQSSQYVNERADDELKLRCNLQERDHALTVCVPHRELTGADRLWAWQYELGDSLPPELNRKTSKSSTFEADEDLTERGFDGAHEHGEKQVRTSQENLQQEYALDQQ